MQSKKFKGVSERASPFFFFFFQRLLPITILAIYFELMLFISSELIINSTLSLFVDDQAFDGSSVGMKNTIASL